MSTKRATVEQVDGGWVLDWKDPESALPLNDGWFPVPLPPPPSTAGREIFTDKKRLIERLEAFF